MIVGNDIGAHLGALRDLRATLGATVTTIVEMLGQRELHLLEEAHRAFQPFGGAPYDSEAMRLLLALSDALEELEQGVLDALNIIDEADPPDASPDDGQGDAS